MSAIGIFAIAFNINGERYDSFHTPPEVKDYIEHPHASTKLVGYADGGRFYKVDTTKSGGQVTASHAVLLPSGVRAPFSYWLIKPDPQGAMSCIKDQTLEVFQGEFGIVGLYFGVRRPPIYWPGFDIKDFDRFVHIMMSHAPSWEPPQPQPRRRRS